jgi:hypothetical protein
VAAADLRGEDAQSYFVDRQCNFTQIFAHDDESADCRMLHVDGATFSHHLHDPLCEPSQVLLPQQRVIRNEDATAGGGGGVWSLIYDLNFTT